MSCPQHLSSLAHNLTSGLVPERQEDVFLPGKNHNWQDLFNRLFTFTPNQTETTLDYEKLYRRLKTENFMGAMEMPELVEGIGKLPLTESYYYAALMGNVLSLFCRPLEEEIRFLRSQFQTATKLNEKMLWFAILSQLGTKDELISAAKEMLLYEAEIVRQQPTYNQTIIASGLMRLQFKNQLSEKEKIDFLDFIATIPNLPQITKGDWLTLTMRHLAILPDWHELAVQTRNELLAYAERTENKSDRSLIYLLANEKLNQVHIVSPNDLEVVKALGKYFRQGGTIQELNSEATPRTIVYILKQLLSAIAPNVLDSYQTEINAFQSQLFLAENKPLLKEIQKYILESDCPVWMIKKFIVDAPNCETEIKEKIATIPALSIAVKNKLLKMVIFPEQRQRELVGITNQLINTTLFWDYYQNFPAFANEVKKIWLQKDPRNKKPNFSFLLSYGSRLNDSELFDLAKVFKNRAEDYGNIDLDAIRKSPKAAEMFLTEVEETAHLSFDFDNFYHELFSGHRLTLRERENKESFFPNPAQNQRIANIILNDYKNALMGYSESCLAILSATIDSPEGYRRLIKKIEPGAEIPSQFLALAADIHHRLVLQKRNKK